MSDSQTFLHDQYSTMMKGTVITARTGKMNMGTKMGSFQAFYVPHKNSLPFQNIDSVPLGNKHIAKALQVHKNSMEAIPDTSLVPSAPYDPDRVDMRDIPIGGLAYGMKKVMDVAKLSRPIKTAAIQNAKLQAYGEISDNVNVGARNNTLIKLVGKCKLSNELGQPTNSAGTFLKVRSGASYKKIRMELPHDPKAMFDHLYIEGRFDIITLAQAYKMGIRPFNNHGLEAMFEPTYFEDVFTVEEVYPALEADEVSTTKRTLDKEGKVIEVQRKRQRRKIGGSGIL